MSFATVVQYDPRQAQQPTPMQSNKPDLDTESAIDELVMRFYYKLLNDDVMAPLFYDVAKIHVASHIRHITLYWYKLLLQDKRYQRHTMRIHRHLDREFPLKGIHFEIWLHDFVETVDEHFAGPNAMKAKHIARRFITHLYAQTHDVPAANGELDGCGGTAKLG